MMNKSSVSCLGSRFHPSSSKIGKEIGYILILLYDDMWIGWVSLLFCLEDLQSVICVEFFVHGLELLDSHGFEPARSALQDTDLELNLAEFLFVLFFLLLLVLLLEHLQFILLFLESLLNDFGTSYDTLLHLFHHVGLDLDGYVQGVNRLIGI